MIKPVPSISVVINGAETTAGSTPKRFRAIGITEETIAAHNVIQTRVKLTMSVIS
ncbi:hypothetical protein D3C81_2082260 [compost metagenome]